MNVALESPCPFFQPSLPFSNPCPPTCLLPLPLSAVREPVHPLSVRLSDPDLDSYVETLVASFEYSTLPLMEPEEFLTVSSVAVVVADKTCSPEVASTSTDGVESEDRMVVLPAELVTLINSLTCCWLDSLNVMAPLCVDTVRVRASMLSTVIDEDSALNTTLPAFSTAWTKMGRLSVLISKSPMLRGNEMATSMTRRGAVTYESRESPPVEMEISLLCW